MCQIAPRLWQAACQRWPSKLPGQFDRVQLQYMHKPISNKKNALEQQNRPDIAVAFL